MVSHAVEIENLTKDYEVGFWRKRQVRALEGLTLTVERGEIFGFLGANGAGKTTTLKLLMRLMYPSGGRAAILGRDISDISMHASIGYLPEHPYFYDYLTAREFLEYSAELFGYGRSKRRARAVNLLGRVGLDEKSWDKQLRKFSKGMLQRVGLAQALVNDPEIVFLDEPMSGLDPVGRREVRDLIASLRANGTTVFLCSHILADIEVLCDRAAVLRRGRLAHLGSLEDLRQLGGDRAMEIIVTGADVSQLGEALCNAAEGARVTATPNGVRIEVESEQRVDQALSIARTCGARLVSVHAVGNPLEELFINDEGRRPETRSDVTG